MSGCRNPLPTSPDVAEDVELAESVSIAMLTVLETLEPTERAVFVLHQVFDTPYGEIAEAIGRSTAAGAADRLASARACGRSAAAREGESDGAAGLGGRFLIALWAGQLLQLLDVMAPDVVLIADGGGLVPAARAPIYGAEQVAKLLARADRSMGGLSAMRVWLNGAPAFRVEIGGQLAAVSLAVENGRVTPIYAEANPEKLTRLHELAELIR